MTLCVFEALLHPYCPLPAPCSTGRNPGTPLKNLISFCLALCCTGPQSGDSKQKSYFVSLFVWPRVVRVPNPGTPNKNLILFGPVFSGSSVLYRDAMFGPE